VIGWIDLRTRIPGRLLLDYAALIPLGLPGIVMAVALIQFWLKMPFALYGTLAILLLAYAGRYVPLGVRAAPCRRQVDLAGSARILGAGWGTTMREVTLPLIRPARSPAGSCVRAGDPGAPPRSCCSRRARSPSRSRSTTCMRPALRRRWRRSPSST
jgi:ABC-type Fe3+ transport system permease subunit